MKTANGIPLLGYGTYPLTGAECRDGVAMALDLGLRHIDTAQLYDNEKDVGRAIAKSGVKREEIFLVTKVARDNKDTAIHVVLDNLNTHKPKNDRWLKRHPNVHFHFTSASCSPSSPTKTSHRASASLSC